MAGQNKEPRQSGTDALRRALAYLRSYKKEAVGAFFSLLLVSGANLITPLLVGFAIDSGITPGELNAILLTVAGLVGVAVTRGVFQFSQGYLAERASQGVAYDLRDALFARIERLSFSYYDRVQTGQLVTRLTNDVEQILQRDVAGQRGEATDLRDHHGAAASCEKGREAMLAARPPSCAGGGPFCNSLASLVAKTNPIFLRRWFGRSRLPFHKVPS